MIKWLMIGAAICTATGATAGFFARGFWLTTPQIQIPQGRINCHWEPIRK